MDRATQNLENDHQHILKLIEVMEAIVKITEPTISHLEEVVALIRQFADGLHHAKEENRFSHLWQRRILLQTGTQAA